MNAENMNEILDALALRFGTTGVYLWGVLVRQQVVMGVMVTLSAMLFFIICMWALMAEARRKTPWYDFTGPSITAVISGVLGLGFLISALTYGIPAMLNPEYYALMDLLP